MLVCQALAEDTVLLSNYQIKEIAQQSTVLDSGGKDCMGRNNSRPITDQSPEIRIHRFETLANQPAKSNGRGRISSLKQVLGYHSILPRLLINLAQQQVGDSAGFWHFERSGS